MLFDDWWAAAAGGFWRGAASWIRVGEGRLLVMGGQYRQSTDAI